MTARPQPDREIRPGITVQDAQDAIAAVDAYRRGSLNATKRVAQRVTSQGNGAGFVTALVWVTSEAIDAFGEDGQADAWWAFFKDGLTASLTDEEVT